MPHGLDQFSLTGKVAVVTGGATGIGLSLVKGLASAGASVLIVSRNKAKLQEAVAECVSETGSRNIDFHAADLAQRADTETIVPAAVERFGSCDILIGNAGQDLLEPVEGVTDPKIDQQIEVNLTSNIVLTRAAIPEMRKRGWGRIVFVTSIAAYVADAQAGVGVYAATKSGLHGFTRVAAHELGGYGITVNSVAPGYTMTTMIREFIDSLGDHGRAYLELSSRTTAMNRWCRPDEMVGPTLMLVSEAGSAITGQVIVVDGGTTTRMKP
jgi:NAD(P)-dependent dehydrogenase (short-subunit alcohol dehydrogenase family)